MSQAARGKLGPNDLCWCKSGKKYKKCHRDSSDFPRPEAHEVISKILSNFKAETRCHAPISVDQTCTESAIRAHSISRMSALSLIAREGHVYQPQLNPFEHFKNKGQMTVRLIGIKVASTFFGFCKNHDNELFERIDQLGFELNHEAIFTLHYRALCKELSAKLPSTKSDEVLRFADRGLPESIQKPLNEALDLRDEVRNLSLKELQEDKLTMDTFLLKKDFGAVQFCILKFECAPIAACSGYVQPVFDFAGKVLQDLNNTRVRVHCHAFTLLPVEGGQIVILSWLPEGAPFARAFAESLLDVPDPKKGTAILQYLFNGFENFALSPEWWESLNAEQMDLINRQMQEWLGPTPFFHLVDPNALKPSETDLANWKFLGSNWAGGQ